MRRAPEDRILSNKQWKAIDLLSTGRCNENKISAECEISIETLRKWMQHDQPFLAELAERREFINQNLGMTWYSIFQIATNNLFDWVSSGDKGSTKFALKCFLEMLKINSIPLFFLPSNMGGNGNGISSFQVPGSPVGENKLPEMVSKEFLSQILIEKVNRKNMLKGLLDTSQVDNPRLHQQLDQLERSIIELIVMLGGDSVGIKREIITDDEDNLKARVKRIMEQGEKESELLPTHVANESETICDYTAEDLDNLKSG